MEGLRTRVESLLITWMQTKIAKRQKKMGTSAHFMYLHMADVLVTWKVEAENNLKHYEVEKSAEGRHFVSLGTVAAEKSQAGNYHLLDQHPATGYHYYRIRSVDLDGKMTLSPIVKIKVEKQAGNISVYPNPIMNGVVNLQMSQQPEGIYRLRLINPVGQVLLTKNLSHAGGNHTEKINWDYKMARGMYQLEVTKPGGEVHVIKVMY